MKHARRFLILSLLGLFLLFALAACAGSPTTTTTGTPATTAGPTTASGTTTAAGQTQKAAVSIQNFAFSPAQLTIKVGTTVVWTNDDSAGHNIKSDAFTSPMMAKGQTFEFTFDKAGTYDYICGVHPTMKGQIIVQ
jgi:amicyanin